jgi:hypothetical protein
MRPSNPRVLRPRPAIVPAKRSLRRAAAFAPLFINRRKLRFLSRTSFVDRRLQGSACAVESLDFICSSLI